MKNLLIMGTLLLSMNSFAGNEKGNGGDICENKMRSITNEIESWLLKDEYKQIKLPKGLDSEGYKAGMLQAAKISLLSCTTDKVSIGSVEKTCRNFLDKSNNIQIECNFSRFNETSEPEKFKLIHHELAGVAGFEVNKDESSNYDISNQISEFLKQEVVLKLGVKRELTNQVGNCKILMPNLSDKNDRYCDRSFGVTYKGYKTSTKCYNSLADAYNVMVQTYSCSKSDEIGDFKILMPNRSDKNDRYCDRSFGVTYQGYKVDTECQETLDEAMKKMEILSK